jgi:hypothetical protein
MAVFLVRFSLVGTVIQGANSGTRLKDNSEEFLKYLPWSPKKTMAYSIGNSEALVFYFGAALDREPIKISQEEIILCHGYGSRGLERRIASAFTSSAALDLTDFPEAFCSIRISLDRVDFGGSAVGTDPLFFFEDCNSLIVTNRHNLLGHWVSNPSLRKDAFAWMAGRAHIGDFGTYWDDIKKTRPGSVYRKISKNPLRETKANFGSLFAPIANGDIPHYVKDVSLEFKTILDSSSREARLWLSGGKDSRAILGLISGSSRFSSMSFQTHGEKFAPDAMSATRVAETIGVASRHSVVRSSMSSPSIDISSAIARDLLSDTSGGGPC